MLRSPNETSQRSSALPRGGVLTAGFAFGLVILAVVAFYSARALHESAASADRVRHTHEVQAAIRGVRERVVEGEIAMRDFALQGKESLVSSMTARLAEAGQGAAKLRRLTSDNPTQQSALDRFAPLLQQKSDFAFAVVQERQERGVEAAIVFMATGRGLEIKQEIDALLEGMDREEQGLLGEWQERASATAQRVQYLLPLGSLFGIGILLAALGYLYAQAAERRRVESLLRKSEADFRLASQTQEATLNALPAHLALLDPAGVIVASE